MDVISRISTVLDAEPNEVQLDKYLDDVRNSLATSNRQFISIYVFAITALVLYHLVAYEGIVLSSFHGMPLPNASIFKRVFIVVPAALFSAVACIGFLRRCQREVYDYLTISRYRVLGQTQLHELRLPSDYMLGLFYLKIEGGSLGKVLAWVFSYLWSMVFFFGPIMYILMVSVRNIEIYGFGDLLTSASSIVAILLVAGYFVIVVITGRIRA